MADLLAYLKKLGGETDTDPGVSETMIKVGAALPMTGALATVGEDIKAALAAYFAEVNAQGGVYGRRFELVIADSRGEPEETTAATRRLKWMAYSRWWPALSRGAIRRMSSSSAARCL